MANQRVVSCQIHFSTLLLEIGVTLYVSYNYKRIVRTQQRMCAERTPPLKSSMGLEEKESINNRKGFDHTEVVAVFKCMSTKT